MKIHQIFSIVLVFLALGLTDALHLKDLFKFGDKNEDEQLSFEEYELTVARQFIHQVDIDGNGTVNYEEFQMIAVAFNISSEKSEQTWNSLDSDSNGEATAEELANSVVASELAKERELFDRFDHNNDTQLSYDEYHGMFESAEPLVELERYRKLLEMHSQEEHDTEADDSEEENEEKLGHGHSDHKKHEHDGEEHEEAEEEDSDEEDHKHKHREEHEEDDSDEEGHHVHGEGHDPDDSSSSSSSSSEEHEED